MIDEWSGFADLLANLIEKYASELDVENLHVPAAVSYTHLDVYKRQSIHLANSAR